jgi:hypothetical protein
MILVYPNNSEAFSDSPEISNLPAEIGRAQRYLVILARRE